MTTIGYLSHRICRTLWRCVSWLLTQSAVIEGGETLTNACEPSRIDFSDRNSFAITLVGQHNAPGIDDH